MTHTALILTLARRIRAAGPAVALDELRTSRPTLHGGAYHHTVAVFLVWAVDRLVAAGLDDLAVLWHPLTDPRSPGVWWDEATLASTDARDVFVPPTRALPGDPVPTEPALLVAA